MTRIMVTGGSGRLGRTVVRHLRDVGHEVHSVDRFVGPEEPAANAVDLTDGASVYATIARLRPEAVVHLAAIAVPFSAPEHVIFRTNTTLAHNVVQASVDLGVGRVVVASSPTVFGYGAPTGWVPDRLPLDEGSPVRPWNSYALSKLVAEQVATTFAARVGDSVRLAAFRPCYVIAPEEWAGAPTQQGHTVRDRLDRPELSAAALFNYVDAVDAARFVDTLVAGMGDIENGQVFMVGAADALASEPLAELMPRYLSIPEALAAPLTGSSPAFSIEKARRELGWEPQVTWRTALADDDGTAAVPRNGD